MAVLSKVLELDPFYIVAVCSGLTVLKLLHYWFLADYNPSKLPVVGLPSGPFSRLRAIPATFSRTNVIVATGYQLYQHGKDAKAFLAPYFLRGYVHILPPTLTGEFKSTSEKIFSMHEAFEDETGTKFTLGTTALYKFPYHLKVIRQKLTQGLDKVLAGSVDEIKVAFSEVWEKAWERENAGAKDAEDDGWHKVDMQVTMQAMTARITNRSFVGTQLCRDEEFLTNGGEFALGMVLCAWGLQLFPIWARRFVAPLVAFKNRRRIAKAEKKLIPLIDERKSIIEHNHSSKPAERLEEPDDILQGIIHAALDLGGEHSTNRAITIRYLILHFASIFSTTLAMTNILMDIAFYSKTSDCNYLELLREELLTVDQTSEEGVGVWTRKKLNKLVGMDSFIREALRRNQTAAVLMTRKVMPEEGYTFSNGLWVKQGEIIGIPALSIHTDSTLCGDGADTFSGFRFSRPYQELLRTQEAHKISAIGGVGKMAAVTTTNEFLAFGHGPHACPGRFYATAILKLMLWHCLVNYDMKLINDKPQRGFVWAHPAPIGTFHLEFKRRVAK